ncbi:MAG: glycosyl hydrolase, partial [Clostridia bacterium]|nr:glycosyl hydrolase [Clostridia bacterium]
MDRIKSIISQMTLDEKASMCSGGGGWTTEEIKRLGIPEIWLTDGPHGLRKHIGRKDSTGADISELAVSFPSAVATASSFNTDIARNIGAEIGEECLRENVQVLLGPGANIKRHPLCGRNFEYFSEDPVLAGDIASAFINGLQSKGVAACVKHFCANNQETWRMTISSEVGERALREIYAAVFERIVKKSKPW